MSLEQVLQDQQTAQASRERQRESMNVTLPVNTTMPAPEPEPEPEVEMEPEPELSAAELAPVPGSGSFPSAKGPLSGSNGAPDLLGRLRDLQTAVENSLLTPQEAADAKNQLLQNFSKLTSSKPEAGDRAPGKKRPAGNGVGAAPKAAGPNTSATARGAFRPAKAAGVAASTARNKTGDKTEKTAKGVGVPSGSVATRGRPIAARHGPAWNEGAAGPIAMLRKPSPAWRSGEPTIQPKTHSRKTSVPKAGPPRNGKQSSSAAAALAKKAVARAVYPQWWSDKAAQAEGQGTDGTRPSFLHFAALDAHKGLEAANAQLLCALSWLHKASSFSLMI